MVKCRLLNKLICYTIFHFKKMFCVPNKVQKNAIYAEIQNSSGQQCFGTFLSAPQPIMTHHHEHFIRHASEHPKVDFFLLFCDYENVLYSPGVLNCFARLRLLSFYSEKKNTVLVITNKYFVILFSVLCYIKLERIYFEASMLQTNDIFVIILFCVELETRSLPFDLLQRNQNFSSHFQSI
jgi:hypothetical protein